MLWGNTAYCVKLSGEDLSRYSNKTESVGLRQCPCYHYLTKKNKWCHNSKHFSELAPHHGVKTADIDMVWRKLRHCHPIYRFMPLFTVRIGPAAIRVRCIVGRQHRRVWSYLIYPTTLAPCRVSEVSWTELKVAPGGKSLLISSACIEYGVEYQNMGMW